MRQGVPFREAHGIVGGFVSRCVASDRSLTDLTPDELRGASPRLENLPELSAAASVQLKRTSGGASPEAVREQLSAAWECIRERQAELGMEATA